MYKPHNFKFWPDDELWKLLFAEYTNYFRRNGTPIPLAVTLFNIFKADLLGLIVDYAEIANVQETVLLEDTAELYDPAIHGEDADRVSMEVENLERALTYRAELRVTAYQILNQLGIASQPEELADFEASEQFSPFKKQDGEYVRDDNGKRIPENPKRAALLEDWLWSTLHPDDAMAFGPEVTDVDVEQLKAIEPLVKAQAILKPVFEQADFGWTDDLAGEILTKVEHLDPLPELQVTAGSKGTDPGAGPGSN